MRESLEGLASWEDVIWAVQAESVALKLKELDPGEGSYSAAAALCVAFKIMRNCDLDKTGKR